jgi:hypothetical protein
VLRAKSGVRQWDWSAYSVKRAEGATQDGGATTATPTAEADAVDAVAMTVAAGAIGAAAEETGNR